MDCEVQRTLATARLKNVMLFPQSFFTPLGNRFRVRGRLEALSVLE